MKRVKKMKLVFAAVFCAFAFSGCYTKLAYYQNETAQYSENCVECVEERALPQTRETCVWERDMFGFAQLRCYNSNYSSSWFYFHNTPWWYRNQYRWYETRGCPQYYYYDRVSGTCRYYGGSRPPHISGGGGEGGGNANASSGSGMRAPRRDLPASSQTSHQNYDGSVPMFPGASTKQLSPVGSPSNTSTPSNDALSKGGHENDTQESKVETSSSKTRVLPEQKSQSKEKEEKQKVTPPKENEEKQQVPPSRRTTRGR
ncbi:MAG: hypothetical protein LBB56_04645 [Chitinispirillales bacterium]|jgi:hypothetical protein|nr:hypothetical protein [Chitinispirillales bacterium]